MGSAENEESGLDGAIAVVYGGPLEEFVQRRSTLVKELRATGQREAATGIKSLRKPTRIAWALDLAAQDGRGTMEALTAAVAETRDAQSAGSDVRSAIVALRGAVREFAGRAAEAAEHAGHPLDAAALANAVLAVLGHPESFRQLRHGYLAEVPEAGGLDLLTTAPVPPVQAQQTRPAPAPEKSSVVAEPEAGVREAARQAALGLAAARQRSEASENVLRDAESAVQAAERRLRESEAELHTARNQRDRLRAEVERAAAELHDAEKAVAEVSKRLSGCGS